MLDLADQLGSHYCLPFWSPDHFSHIILHDGLILLHHDILAFLLLSSFFNGGGL
jgi:hypothetical protein